MMYKIVLFFLLMPFPYVVVAQSFVTPQQYGAKGDGKTDDTKAIQKALDASNAVFFPTGTYLTSASLIVHSNTTLWGAGRESRILNTVETGFGKNVLVCGQIDSGTDRNSPNVLKKQTASLAQDRRTLFLEKSLDCIAGDLVLITSGQTGTHNPAHCYVAKVSSITGKKTIVLNDFVSNTFLSERVMVQVLKGFPDKSSYVAENICVHDLSIEQEKNSGSGMYVLLLACYRSSFYNLWLKGNTCIGSNMTVKTTFTNIECVFDGGAVDSPEYFIESKYSNIHGFRFGSRMNQIGFSILHGYAGVIENCDLDFGNNGKVGMMEQIHPVVTGNRFRNLSSKSGGIQGSMYGRSYIAHNVLTSIQTNPLVTLYGTENVFIDNWIESATPRWLFSPGDLDYSRNDVSGNHIIGLDRNDALYQSLPFGEISTLRTSTMPATVIIKPRESVTAFNPSSNDNNHQSKMTTVTIYFNNAVTARIVQDGGGTPFTFNAATLKMVLAQGYIMYSAGDKNLRVVRKGDGKINITNIGKDNIVYTLSTIEQE